MRLKAPNSQHFKTTGTLNPANRKRLAVVSVTPVSVLSSKQFLQSGAQLQLNAAGAQQMKHTPWLNTSWLYNPHVLIIMYVWTLIECFMGEHILWGYTSVHTLIISLVYLVCPTSAWLLGLSCTYLRYSTWLHLLLSLDLLLFCVCRPLNSSQVYLPGLDLQRQLQTFLHGLQQLVVQRHHLRLTPQQLRLHRLLPARRKQKEWHIPQNTPTF